LYPSGTKLRVTGVNKEYKKVYVEMLEPSLKGRYLTGEKWEFHPENLVPCFKWENKGDVLSLIKDDDY